MLSLVGIGGAGSRIVESFYRKDIVGSIIKRISFRGGDYVRGVAIDTSDNITALRAIPAENRVLIGSSRAKGHGTGGNVELGRKIVEEEIELAMNAIRRANYEKPEVFFVSAGIGGGTGTGGLPVIARRIKITYNVPVIGVLVLPSKSEGTLYVKNAFKNFGTVAKSVDGVICADNSVLTNRGEDILSSYREIDQAIFNFLSVIEPYEIKRIAEDNMCAIGFMRTRSSHISIKDIMEKMFRDYVYFNVENKKIKGVYLIIYGDMNNVYGHEFAKGFVEKKYKAELEYIFKDDPNAKYLNIGLIITGLSDIEKEFEIKTEEKKPLSELEELLGDIKPL